MTVAVSSSLATIATCCSVLTLVEWSSNDGLMLSQQSFSVHAEVVAVRRS